MHEPAGPRDEIVDVIVAQLRDGSRTPLEALASRPELSSWDRDALGRLQADLHEAQREGRLSHAHLCELVHVIETWQQAAADVAGDLTDTFDEADQTEALEERLLAATSHWASAPQVEPSVLELRPGVTLRDRYVLGEPIARGGQSIVFRGRDLRRDPDSGDAGLVAIKVLRDDRVSEAAIARLRREFRQTQSLQHAGVPQMFDLERERGTWFLTMELLRGMSLRTRLNRAATQPLDADEALRIAAACADVLACAHRRGIPHGDVKPSNVFLEEGGGVKVLDFGSAQDIQPAPPRAALDAGSVSAVATRTYASPEVLDGLPAEPRDDIFSLACVTYEMLAGRHPFGRLPASDARDRSIAAAPVAGLSPTQNAVLARALAWSRAERPASIEEWTNALLDRGDGSTADDTRPPSLAGTNRRSVRWGWTAAIAAAAVLLVLAAAYWRSGGDRVAVTRAPEEPVAARSTEIPPRPAPRQRPQDAPLASEPEIQVATPSPRPVSTAVTEAPLPAAGPASPPPRAPPVRPDRVRLAADSSSIRTSERAAAAVVLLRRIGESSAPATVTWRVVDGSARTGEDYSSTPSASTRFQRGETTRTIYVPLVDDAVPELEEFFSLILASPTADLGDSNRVVVTVVDDD